MRQRTAQNVHTAAQLQSDQKGSVHLIDDYSTRTKNTQKYFKQFQSLTMIT
jgi:hypothetical protein